HNSSGIAWPPAGGARFDVRALADCLRRPPDWKQRHGFPLEVLEILGLSPEGEPGVERAPNGTAPAAPEPAWQAVILDRPEHILAARVGPAGGPGGRELVGLPVRQDGWVLLADSPLFRLKEDWQRVFPELAGDPSPEAWRQAWRAWAESRALPAAE